MCVNIKHSIFNLGTNLWVVKENYSSSTLNRYLFSLSSSLISTSSTVASIISFWPFRYLSKTNLDCCRMGNQELNQEVSQWCLVSAYSAAYAAIPSVRWDGIEVQCWACVSHQFTFQTQNWRAQHISSSRRRISSFHLIARAQQFSHSMQRSGLWRC